MERQAPRIDSFEKLAELMLRRIGEIQEQDSALKGTCKMSHVLSLNREVVVGKEPGSAILGNLFYPQ